MDYIQEKLKEMNFLNFKNIKYVAYMIKGDDYLKNSTWLIVCDHDNYIFKLSLHGSFFEMFEPIDELICNILFMKMGILHSELIGVNLDITQAIDKARKIYPYKGKFFVNEEKTRFYDYGEEIHIF